MAGIQEPQSRNPNLGFPIQQSKSRNPNPAFPVQESQSRRGALPTNGNGVHFPIQHSQSRRLNPGGVRNPGVVHFPNPFNILIMSL